ncbi:MAG: DEAD/DEAH box helicase, partial [Microthrixaceae bacterium]
MGTEGWEQPWRVRHRTVAHYEPLVVRSPAAVLIVGSGLLDSLQGPVAVADAFGPAFSEWCDIVPSVQLTDAAARALGLDGSVDEVLVVRWSDELFRQIAGAADDAQDGRAVRLLRIAADLHLVPPDGTELPPLTDRLSEAEEFRAKGERVWLCAPEHLKVWPAGWDFPGLERPPADAVGEYEIVTLDEYFPALAARVGDGSIQVWECDGVLQGQDAVEFGRRGDAFLVDRLVELSMVYRWLADELLYQSPASERQAVVDRQIADGAEETARAVREQVDDVGRLVALLGPDGLAVACDELAEWSSVGEPQAQASLLLTLYGPSTLRMVRHLMPVGLGVPQQWAGGDRTVRFIERLGFDTEFAGRRKAERADVERVAGPVVAGELHDFQREIADRVLEILSEHRRGIVDLPTGAGKTRVAIESVLDHAAEQGRLGTVLWVAEREELCEQAVTQWLQLWRARGLTDRELTVLRFWGGRTPSATDPDSDTVVVASRQQLVKRLSDGRVDWLQRAGIVIIDEAHHSTARTYRQLINWRKDGGADPFAVLGLSATPFRSGDDPSADLARLFDRSLVTGSMMGDKWKRRIKWLQKHDYLSKVKWRDLERGEVEPTEEEAQYLTEQANLTTGINQMNERLARNVERNEQILGSIRDLDPEWPVVVFAGSVLHAQQLAVMHNDEGISARPVWGDLSQWARRHAIEEFRSNRVRVL